MTVFDAGELIPGTTVEEAVVDMSTAPEWNFAHEPYRALSHATVRAADANVKGLDHARIWTHIACGLVAVAASPVIYRGLVLENLVAKYGDGLA